jgi:hypothetical protein
VATGLADRLIELAFECTLDPYKFVMAAFPWGEPGDLVNDKGPRQWQREVLQEIGERLRAGYAPGSALMPMLKAIATGHGVGKSALMAWIGLWGLTTCQDAKVMLTANTEAQIRTKTWPEISLWARRSIFSPWFTVTGTTIHSTDPEHARTWRLDAVTWSENNLEAFAGLHNRIGAALSTATAAAVPAQPSRAAPATTDQRLAAVYDARPAPSYIDGLRRK